MDQPHVAPPSLSIGYYSPGWPVTAFANGIVTYIGTLVPALEAMGHQVTIIAGRVPEETSNGSVYNVQQVGRRRAYLAARSTGSGIASRRGRHTGNGSGGGSQRTVERPSPSGGFRSSRWKSRLGGRDG